MAWGLVAAFRGRTALPPPQEGGGNDIKMYSAIAARVAAGENYYRVLADELPARGYAIRPVFNWRLPTLSWLNAIPPPRVWSRVLLVAIGAAVIVLWLVAIRGAVPRLVLVPVLLLGTGPLLIISASVVFYEVWAGLLIAASLACSGLGHWKWSVVLGAAALLIRELALPFIVIMAAFAWWEGRRREVFSWLAVVGVFAVFLALAYLAGPARHPARWTGERLGGGRWLGEGAPSVSLIHLSDAGTRTLGSVVHCHRGAGPVGRILVLGRCGWTPARVRPQRVLCDVHGGRTAGQLVLGVSHRAFDSARRFRVFLRTQGRENTRTSS